MIHESRWVGPSGIVGITRDVHLRCEVGGNAPRTTADVENREVGLEMREKVGTARLDPARVIEFGDVRVIAP